MTPTSPHFAFPATQDLGSVLFDEAFDLEDPQAQAALLHACTSLPRLPGLQVQPGSSQCMVSALAEWAAGKNISFPMPRQQFHEAFPRFIASQPVWLSAISFDPLCRSSTATAESPAAGCEGEAELSWRLRHVAVSFHIEIGNAAPAHVLRSLCKQRRARARASNRHTATAECTAPPHSFHSACMYASPHPRPAPSRQPSPHPSPHRWADDKWQAALSDLNVGSPSSAQHAVQSAGALWVRMAITEIITTAALGVIICSAVVGFVFILMATRSPRIACISTLTICATVAAWGGLARLCGMLDNGLGVIEALVMMVSVGLMLDPLTHIAFSYAEAGGSPLHRLGSALSTIGVSVLGSAVSTAGPCALMLSTTIILFSQFAMLFCSLTLITLLYAHFLMAPLLLLLGPPSSQRAAPASSCTAVLSLRCLDRRRRRRSTGEGRGLRGDDSAAAAHAADVELHVERDVDLQPTATAEGV